MSRSSRTLPGFGLSLGYATFYMSVLVLIPLAGLALKSAQLSWHDFWSTITDAQVLAACKLSFLAAMFAAILNGFFGTICAWALVRYRFPGRKILDAIIDFPFAMPTAVAGLTFGDLFTQVPFLNRDPSKEIWLLFGLDGLDLVRVTIMLTFVGLPYVIRSIQPVLQDWDIETEQAAMSLGAGPVTILRRLIAPEIFPAWLSGVALSFARGVGGQIAPQLIYDLLVDPIDPARKIAQATSIGLVMLIVSLIVLLLLNGLDAWNRRRAA
jgi:sulfate transport system permease protein